MDVGPIPLQPIIAYLDEVGVEDPEDRQRVIRIIGAMDSSRLALAEEVKNQKPLQLSLPGAKQP